MKKKSIKICPERSLFLHSDFTEKEADNLIKKLFELNLVKGEIFLQINCHVGSFTGGQNLHENILLSPNPVIGVVSGKCYDIATFILQACKKRYATQFSDIGVNYKAYRFPIKLDNDSQIENLTKILQSELDQIRQENEILVKILSQKTTNKNALMQLFEQKKVIKASEAKEIGLIDDVI